MLYRDWGHWNDVTCEAHFNNPYICEYSIRKYKKRLIDWSVFNALSKVFQPLSAVLQQKSLEGNNVEKHNDCITLQRSTFIENMRSNKILFSFEDYNRPTTTTATTTTTTRATTTSTSKPVTTATLSEYFITRSWITIDPKIYKKWGQRTNDLLINSSFNGQLLVGKQEYQRCIKMFTISDSILTTIWKFLQRIESTVSLC